MLPLLPLGNLDGEGAVGTLQGKGGREQEDDQDEEEEEEEEDRPMLVCLTTMSGTVMMVTVTYKPKQCASSVILL